MPIALLLLAVGVNLLPEPIAAMSGGSIKAWEFVAGGIEAAALWWAVAALYERQRGPWLLPVQVVCAYGMFESLLRPSCRLMFPMDRAPVIKQPYGLCEAAGIPAYDFTPILIALCALVLSSALQAHYRAQHPK